MPLKDISVQPSPAEAEVARHVDTVFQMLTGHWVSQIVRAAADLRIADHVAAGAGTADDVAGREASDPAATYRLMRACASLGLLASEEGRRFSLTPLGQVLREGVPGSLREAALVQGALGHWQSWGQLPEAVRTGETGAELALGEDMFEYLEKNPAEAALFSKAMSNMTNLVVEDTVNLLDLGEATNVVDLGGADGALVIALMRAHPQIRGRVFDLQHVVPGAARAAGEAGVSDRFATAAGDFFAGVPEADYYLLKWILHDWSDDQCRTILANCREAALPGARVLVIEALVGESGTSDPAAVLDMNMLAVSSGRERDLREFDALFAATGWKRTAVSPTRSLYSLIELEAV
jgi:hypothetical protein